MNGRLATRIAGALVLITCGASRPPPLTPTSLVDAMKLFKDKMCRCTNVECIRRVTDEMREWTNPYSRDLELMKLSDAETNAVGAIAEEKQQCEQRVTGEGWEGHPP